MKWNLATRYQILLEINNAIISETSREDFFYSLSRELKKHFPYDRLSINLYDEESQSLKYFTSAYGIEPEGISSLNERPLVKGSIAKMAIQSGQPVIIDDLTHYRDLSSIEHMVKAGLTSTMAFPLIIRNRILGTLHFSFKNSPDHWSELSELIAEVSKQVAIAVDNLVAYTRLRDEKKNLEREKRYLITVSDGYRLDNFYYVSPEMTEIMVLVNRVAEIDAPVLISGETGTGKDFLASYIHKISPRQDHMFVKINCPAIPPTLFESELFGHVKGAFTGANSQRAGRFEMADKGTVFLDEFGELPDHLQAKLLEVMQDGRFERVGDSRPVHVNFRVIAATNRNPEKSIREGKLREDLYYRLNVIRIHIPPLRERVEDIPYLVEHISRYEAAQINQRMPHFTQPALDLLSTYHWAGNVRELKNMVKRMTILRPGAKIHASEIKKMIDIEEKTPKARERDIPTLAESERKSIEQALSKCKGIIGGKNGAAHLLDVPRSTLQYRLKKLGINPREYV